MPDANGRKAGKGTQGQKRRSGPRKASAPKKLSREAAALIVDLAEGGLLQATRRYPYPHRAEALAPQRPNYGPPTWRTISRGALSDLITLGLIDGHPADRPRCDRIIYTITDAGHAVAKAHGALPREPDTQIDMAEQWAASPPAA